MCGWLISAKTLVLDEPPLIEKTQKHITEQVKTWWIDFLQKTYDQIEEERKKSDNPLVRMQLYRLSTWIKQEYAIDDDTRTATPIRKEQVFLTKDGKRMVRRWAAFSPAYAWIQGDTSVVSVSEKVSVPIAQKQKEHTSASSAPLAISPSPQRYNLAHGRINISVLRETWIHWVNTFRKKEGVKGEITHAPALDKTAIEWCYKMREDGTWSHKRTLSSSYYDYKEIEQRFADRWFIFKNVNRTTFTENVGEGYLSCSEWDCTNDALRSLRNTFDYFAGEKNQSYDAHYRTLVQPYFKIMGFGIAIDEEKNIIYSTMHYGTEIVR